MDDPIDNLWRNRDFGLYFSGVFKVTLANQIQSVAVASQIYSITRSPLTLARRRQRRDIALIDTRSRRR